MNNFNNILTKTESLRTLQGGLKNSESGGGGSTWHLQALQYWEFFKKKLQIFTEKRRARSPQTTPKSDPFIIQIETVSFSIIYVLLKILFGNSQERFDNLTYPAIVNVERKSFTVC